MNNDSKGSVLIIVQSIEDDTITLVEDPSKPSPIYWKFPGGKVKFWRSETHAEAAQRELKEETGLKVSLEQVKMIDYESKPNHVLTIFGARITSFTEIAKIGETGEITHVCTLEKIQNLIASQKFHPNHIEHLKHLKDGLLDLSSW